MPRLNAERLGWSARAAVPRLERVGVELAALSQRTPLMDAAATFDSVQRTLLAATGPAALAAAKDPQARADVEQQAEVLLIDLDRRFRDVTRTHAPAAAVSPNATDDQGRAFATASFAYERALKAAIEFREALSSAPGTTAKPPLTADALRGRVAVLFTNSANFVSSLPVHSVQNASPFTHAALLYKDTAGQLWVVEMSNGIVHTRWEDFLAAQPPRWAVYELSSQEAREKVEARVDGYVAGLEGKRWSLVEDEDSLPCVGVVDGLLGQALGTPGVLVNSEAARGEGNERRFLDLLGPDLVRQYRQAGVREPGSLVFNPALQLSSLHHDPATIQQVRRCESVSRFIRTMLDAPPVGSGYLIKRRPVLRGLAEVVPPVADLLRHVSSTFAFKLNASSIAHVLEYRPIFEALEQALALEEADYEKRLGYPMSTEVMMTTLEQLRLRDQAAQRVTGRSLFHDLVEGWETNG